MPISPIDKKIETTVIRFCLKTATGFSQVIFGWQTSINISTMWMMNAKMREIHQKFRNTKRYSVIVKLGFSQMETPANKAKINKELKNEYNIAWSIFAVINFLRGNGSAKMFWNPLPSLEIEVAEILVIVPIRQATRPPIMVM